MGYKILTLNLGTTSTRISLYDGNEPIAEHSLYHPEEELAKNTEAEHVGIRERLIVTWLNETGYELSQIDAIAVRTGSLEKIVAGGAYLVNEALRNDLYKKYMPDRSLMHGNQLIMPIADALAKEFAIKIYAVEPANQNDMIPEARISGFPDIERSAVFHALNEKHVAKLQAEKLKKPYSQCNFITAHMGGGISVSCHQKGRVTDTTNCIGNEGAFSATRVGYLPVIDVVNLCYGGKYTKEELLKTLMSKSGVTAYLGTSDMREAEARAKAGDEEADLLFRTVAYRTAKEIGALCATVKGEIDGILLTGGMSHSEKMVGLITDCVERFGPVSVYPGERESEALAHCVNRVLVGEENSGVY
jgi:butyrate kinase